MFFHTRSISLKVLQLHFPSLFPRELFLRLQVYIFSSSSQQLKVIPLQAKKKKKIYDLHWHALYMQRKVFRYFWSYFG